MVRCSEAIFSTKQLNFMLVATVVTIFLMRSQFISAELIPATASTASTPLHSVKRSPVLTRCKYCLNETQRNLIAAAHYLALQTCGGTLARARREAKHLVVLLTTSCKEESAQLLQGVEISRYLDQHCVDSRSHPSNLVPRLFQHPSGFYLTDARGNVTYVPIPKVASTSIREILVPAKGLPTQPMSDLVAASRINTTLLAKSDLGDRFVYRDMHPLIKQASFKFAVVRDPLERFTSAWREVGKYRIGKYKVDRYRPTARLTFRTLAEPGFIHTVKPTAYSMREAANSEAKFWKNVSQWQRDPGRVIRRMACMPEMDAHLTPQSPYLKPFLRDLDMLLPIGDLEMAAQMISTRLGASRKQGLGHHNHRPGWPSPAEFAALLTGDERDIWCWLHLEDYLRFRRFFEPPPWCGGALQAAEAEAARLANSSRSRGAHPSESPEDFKDALPPRSLEEVISDPEELL